LDAVEDGLTAVVYLIDRSSWRTWPTRCCRSDWTTWIAWINRTSRNSRWLVNSM